MGRARRRRAVLLCCAYRLDRGQVHPFLRALPEVIHIPAGPGRHPALRTAVDLLGADVRDSRPGVDAALPALLDLLLVYVLRAWLDVETSRSPSAGWCAALTDPAIAAALNHIHRHTAHPWTVQNSPIGSACRGRSSRGGPPTWWDRRRWRM
ncbi:cupin domain-containing protein [Streptomyces shaanxiensis]|uniref:cupin domain-containing protein n=1 Tax=Streptomyces shaanxiensis TaxID=653357 RepID=UPI003CD0B5E1